MSNGAAIVPNMSPTPTEEKFAEYHEMCYLFQFASPSVRAATN